MSQTTNIVVIGASAGGVSALSTVIGGLPADLDAAVLVVLHIPAHSKSELPRLLQRVTSLTVVAATDGERIRAGHVYVAQADRHLVVQHGSVRITRGPRECRVRPAIDVLFRSAAAAYGPHVIGVILTGMLDDGTAGLWSIKDSGGVALVQDPETAEYSSMPESALGHVAVDMKLPLEELADEITRRVRLLPGTPDSHPVTDSQKIETTIAMEGNSLQAGVMTLGEISKYTCPECHGVLVEIKEGRIVRFRCHTGHAYTVKTLLAEVNESIDKGLWDTLRALEERILLLRQMGQIAASAGDEETAKHSRAQATIVEHRVEAIRKLVLDPELFGGQPGEIGPGGASQ